MDDQHHSAERTALYRCFDSNGDLLYVGITKNIGMRWQKHSSASVWWPQVRRQTIDWYDTRTAAEIAERIAIQAEDPKYNRYRYDTVQIPAVSPPLAAMSSQRVTCRQANQPCRRPGPFGCDGESDLGYPCLLVPAVSRG